MSNEERAKVESLHTGYNPLVVGSVEGFGKIQEEIGAVQRFELREEDCFEDVGLDLSTFDKSSLVGVYDVRKGFVELGG